MKLEKSKITEYKPSKETICIKTIDTHTAGEPLRIIYNGFPELKGSTVIEKRLFARNNFDHLRRSLMWEPRGHSDMYGCLINPPINEDSDFSVLFLHNEGFSTMCGHGIIGVTTALIETGAVAIKLPETTIRIDTPAGLVIAIAIIENNKVLSVKFQNVPSYVYAIDRSIEIPEVGKVNYDIAFGGAYYAIVDAEKLNLGLVSHNSSDLISLGRIIKQKIVEKEPIIHPFEKEMSFLYGTIFVGRAHTKTSHSRNVCIFADGEVDRSPTGTGVSARLALHFYRKEIGINETIEIESIIGSKFKGSVIGTAKYDRFDSVIPLVEGKAHITGKHEFYIDPEDILKDGFFIR